MKYNFDKENKKELGLTYQRPETDDNIYNEARLSPLYPELLQDLLDAHEMSQFDLCELVGQGKSSVFNYMAGNSVPKREFFDSLIEYFGLPENYFYLTPTNNHPNYAMHEVDNHQIQTMDIPIISNTHLYYEEDSVFDPANYLSVFSIPFYTRSYMSDTVRRLFAVCMDYESLVDVNGEIGSLAVFYRTQKIADGDIAVVYLKSKQFVTARRVHYTENSITFSCDQSTDTYDLLNTQGDFCIIGKVVAMNRYTFLP